MARNTRARVSAGDERSRGTRLWRLARSRLSRWRVLLLAQQKYALRRQPSRFACSDCTNCRGSSDPLNVVGFGVGGAVQRTLAHSLPGLLASSGRGANRWPCRCRSAPIRVRVFVGSRLLSGPAWRLAELAEPAVFGGYVRADCWVSASKSLSSGSRRLQLRRERESPDSSGDHVQGLSRNARSVTNRRIVTSLSNAAPLKPGAS